MELRMEIGRRLVVAANIDKSKPAANVKTELTVMGSEPVAGSRM